MERNWIARRTSARRAILICAVVVAKEMGQAIASRREYPDSFAFCATGIALTSNSGLRVCCSSVCGACGGKSCADRPGGRSACCVSDIVHANRICRGDTDTSCLSYFHAREAEALRIDVFPFTGVRHDDDSKNRPLTRGTPFTGLRSAKEHCLKNGYGGFVIRHGNVYFLPLHRDALLQSARRKDRSMLLILKPTANLSTSSPTPFPSFVWHGT